MGGSLPSPISGQSNLEIINREQVYALAAERGHPYTDAEKQQFEQLLRRHVGEFNGQALEGGLFGGISTLGDWFGKFLQTIVALIKGENANLQEAAASASGTATEFSQRRASAQGLMRLNIAMREAGGNLAASADLVTGMYHVPADRTVNAPAGATDPRTLDAQIATARGPQTITDNREMNLTLNPTYEPQDVTIVTPPPVTPAAPRNPAGTAIG